MTELIGSHHCTAAPMTLASTEWLSVSGARLRVESGGDDVCRHGEQRTNQSPQRSKARLCKRRVDVEFNVRALDGCRLEQLEDRKLSGPHRHIAQQRGAPRA